jgi:hypothetical protein
VLSIVGHASSTLIERFHLTARSTTWMRSSRDIRAFRGEWPDQIAGAGQGGTEYALLRHERQRQRPDDVKL